MAELITRLQSELNDLRRYRAAAATVEFAKGVLAERLSCSPAEAGEQLDLLAGQFHTSLVEVAVDVIDQSANDELARAALQPPHRHRARLAEAAAQSATDGDEIAAAVFDQALAALGASSLALWTVEPDGALDLAGETGLSALDASRWQRIPPQMDSLAQRVLTDGTPRWWPRGAPKDNTTPLVGSTDGARVALPLVESGAQVGVMEVCWPEPLDPFTAAVRRQLLAMAKICGRGLGLHRKRAWDGRASWLPALLDGLNGSAMLAHAVRNTLGEVIDFHVDHVTERFVDPAGRDRRDLLDRTLLELYPLTAVPGGLFEHVTRVHATGRPFHAEHLVIRVLVDGVEVPSDIDVRVTRLFDGVAIGWRVADSSGRLAALLQHAEQMGQLGGWEQDLHTGDVLWTDNTYAVFQIAPPTPPIPLEALDAHVHPDDVAAVALFRDALLNLARPAFTSFRLVRPDGAVRIIRAFGESVIADDGTKIAVRGTYQDLSAAHSTQIALAATRDQLASSERLAEDQRRLALRLQRSIMAFSAPLPRGSGLDIAVRYRPAEQEHLVSGDWYNAVKLPNGDIFIAVGDIAGHGIEAVTGMVNLRYSLRGLAVTGAGPGQILAWLNTISYHFTDNITGTVMCGLYDPESRILRWSRAGHLPPVLVRDGKARALPLPNGMLLGVLPDAKYEETTTVLQPGDTLMLFTDGLVERRRTSMDDALDALLRLAERPADDIEWYADHILNNTMPDTGDDTCLIAVHVH